MGGLIHFHSIVNPKQIYRKKVVYRYLSGNLLFYFFGVAINLSTNLVI